MTGQTLQMVANAAGAVILVSIAALVCVSCMVCIGFALRKWWRLR